MAREITGQRETVRVAKKRSLVGPERSCGVARKKIRKKSGCKESLQVGGGISLDRDRQYFSL